MTAVLLASPALAGSSTYIHDSSAPRPSLQTPSQASLRNSLQFQPRTSVQTRQQGSSNGKAPVPKHANISYNTLLDLVISDVELWLVEQWVPLDEEIHSPGANLEESAARDSSEPSQLSQHNDGRRSKPKWYHTKYFGYIDKNLHGLRLLADIIKSLPHMFRYTRRRLREGFRTNPYGLSATCFVIMWLFLVTSAIGSIVVSRFEPMADLEKGEKPKSVIYAAMFKSFFTALPLLTTGTVFLFPPLYMPY